MSTRDPLLMAAEFATVSAITADAGARAYRIHHTGDSITLDVPYGCVPDLQGPLHLGPSVIRDGGRLTRTGRVTGNTGPIVVHVTAWAPVPHSCPVKGCDHGHVELTVVAG